MANVGHDYGHVANMCRLGGNVGYQIARSELFSFWGSFDTLLSLGLRPSNFHQGRNNLTGACPRTLQFTPPFFSGSAAAIVRAADLVCELN